QFVLRFVGGDPANEENVRVPVLEQLHPVWIGGLSPAQRIDDDGQHAWVAKARLAQLRGVVRGHSGADRKRSRQFGKMFAPGSEETRVRRVPPLEERGRRHVV